MPVLESEVVVAAPREEVFAFFADPRNLPPLMPGDVRVRLLPPVPARVREGTLLAHVVRARGLPLLWVARFREVEPPRRFVDAQVAGPFLRWRHEHLFEEADGGTRVRDLVAYEHLGGPPFERRVVRPLLERVFAHRRDALRRRFGAGGP